MPDEPGEWFRVNVKNYEFGSGNKLDTGMAIFTLTHVGADLRGTW